MTNVYGKTPEERREIGEAYDNAMQDLMLADSALRAYDEAQK